MASSSMISFYIVADLPTIEDVGDVRQWHHDEPPSMCLQRCLDALFHGEERQRIICIDAVCVANSDADLSDAPQSFLN